MGTLPSVLLRTQPDSRLVTLCVAGHEAAFEVIVDRYRAELTRRCARVVGEARAADAVQPALLSAWKALQGGAEVRELRGWLHVAAHRSALRVLADRDRCLELPETLPDRSCLEAEAESRAEARRVLGLVAALPGNQREALVLTELHGLTREQVATALGVTDGAVRALVHRARTSVRAVAALAMPPGVAAQLAEWAGGGSAAGALGGALLVKGVGVVVTGLTVAGVGGMIAAGSPVLSGDGSSASAASAAPAEVAPAAPAPTATPAPVVLPASSTPRQATSAPHRGKHRRAASGGGRRTVGARTGTPSHGGSPGSAEDPGPADEVDAATNDDDPAAAVDDDPAATDAADDDPPPLDAADDAPVDDPSVDAAPDDPPVDDAEDPAAP